MSEKSEQQSNGRNFIRGIETFSAFVGGLTGLIALGLVVFKGGQLVQVIESHEARLTTIESNSTPPAQRHIAVDDARDLELQKQIAEMRIAITSVSEVRADVRVLSFKIDNLTKTLEEHIKAKP